MKIKARIALACLVLTQLMCIQYSRGQHFSVRGNVLDSGTTQPVARASVYLANSSAGAVTGADGSFLLAAVPAGTYELIVSAIGYKAVRRSIHIAKDEAVTILLTANVAQLKEVVVAAPAMKKSLRKKWMDIFSRSVIGTSAFARLCVIKNAADIKFQYTAGNRLLTASCNNPLVIENPALGYVIRYQLTGFRYNDSLDVVSYAGYPYYEPMAGTARQEGYWRRNRAAVYGLSLLRFMRSVYNRSLPAEGYTLSWLRGVTDTKLVESQAAGQRDAFTQGVLFAAVDTGAVLQADSIGRRAGNGFTLSFRPVVLVNQAAGNPAGKKLLVEYAGEKWDEALLSSGNGGKPAGVYAGDLNARNRISSMLRLQPGARVSVYANGYYSNGTELHIMGLFAWLEKLGTLLPLDYYPEN